MPWYNFLHVSCASSLLHFLDLEINSSQQIGGKIDHYFFKCISDWLNYVYDRQLDAIPQCTDDLFISYIILFLCVSFWVICISMSSQPISFSAVSHLPLQQSSIVFISHVVIFNSRSSVQVFCTSRVALITISYLSPVFLNVFNNVLTTGFTVLVG